MLVTNSGQVFFIISVGQVQPRSGTAILLDSILILLITMLQIKPYTRYNHTLNSTWCIILAEQFVYFTVLTETCSSLTPIVRQCAASRRGPPKAAPGNADAGTHPAMPEELAVAAVTVLALLLVGGGGGAGAVLRAAVLVRALVPVVLLWVVHAVLAAMPFAVRVAAKPRRACQQAACPAGVRARCGPARPGAHAGGTA